MRRHCRSKVQRVASAALKFQEFFCRFRAEKIDAWGVALVGAEGAQLKFRGRIRGSQLEPCDIKDADYASSPGASPSISCGGATTTRPPGMSTMGTTALVKG